MVKRLRSVASGLAMAMMGSTAAPAIASDAKTRAVVVNVVDYSGLPSRELAPALQEAAGIYAQAGVSLHWVFGEPAGLNGDLATAPLRVMLICREMSEKKAVAEGISKSALGGASRNTGRAYIFVDRVVDAGRQTRSDYRRLLGRVIAHEVGHLLLPESGHSLLGIMAEAIETRPVAQRFTVSQAAALRGAAIEIDQVVVCAPRPPRKRMVNPTCGRLQ